MLFSTSLDSLKLKVSQAEAALASAEAACSAARVVFFEDGAAASEKNYQRSLDAAQSARLHLERAQHQLDVAAAKQAADAHAADLKLATELEAELTRPDSVEAELVASSVAALVTFSEKQSARFANQAALLLKRRKLDELRARLGLPPLVSPYAFREQPGFAPIASSLAQLASGAPNDDVRARTLLLLAEIRF